MIPLKQKSIHDALVGTGDLRPLIGNPAETNLYYGVDNLCVGLPRIPDEPMAAYVATQIQSLGAVLGLNPVWNPEGGSKFPAKERPEPPSALQIVEAMDPRIDFPNPFEGESGLVTDRGVASYRAVHAIYQAARLHHLSNGRGRCIEIGAGMGRTAYYAHRLGLTDYTIVDLPVGLVGQAAFLAGALGEEKVVLPGETGDGVKLRPPQWIRSTRETFDIALNVDSMTEMSAEYAREYIELVRYNCKIFLSINHEANDFAVRELADGMALSRHLYPLRDGYVEEFAVLQPSWPKTTGIFRRLRYRRA